MHQNWAAVAVLALSLGVSAPAYAGWEQVDNGRDYVYRLDDGSIAKDCFIDGYYVDMDGVWVPCLDLELEANRCYTALKGASDLRVKVADGYNNNEVIKVATYMRDLRMVGTKSILCSFSSTGEKYVQVSGVSYYQIEADDAFCDKYLTDVANQFRHIESDRDKVIALNDWMIEQFEYDYSEKNSTIKALIDTKTGTCLPYSAMFKRICNKMGIQCDIIQGTAQSNIGIGRHAWNRVYIDGVAYYNDTCWNDTSRRSQDYLLISLEQISKDHWED